MLLVAPRSRIAPRLVWREIRVLITWVALIAWLEVSGRRSTSDVEDAVGALGFWILVGMTAASHRRAPLRCVSLAMKPARPVGAWLQRQRTKFGVDLRAEPLLPRRVPRWLWQGFVAAIALCTLAWALHPMLPEGFRSVLLTVSPTLWFALLGPLWVALFAGLVLFAVFLPVALLHDHIQNVWHAVSGRRRGLWHCMLAGGALAVVGLIASLPPIVPLALATCAVAIPALLLALPGTPAMSVCWQSSGERADVWVSDWTVFMSLPVVGGFAALMGLVVFACGGSLTGWNVDTMPITTGLGYLFAWSLLIGACYLGVEISSAIVRARRRNPSVAVPAIVRFVTAADSPDVAQDVQATAALAASGIGTSRQIESLESACAVPIALDADATTESWQWSMQWPLRVAPTDLSHPDLIARVQRRDELLRRRALMRGLQKCFKAASQREFARGEGFWVNPHLWISTGLARDVDEEASWTVGPQFRTVMPLAARAHAHTVFRALSVDLLFVEDGVGFRKLKRVYATMFDWFDKNGSSRPLEDMQFSGVPGVRVILHVYDIDTPLDTEGYDEPDYRGIGRARILHVFKDRGGDESDVLAPSFSDFVPDRLPALV